MQVHCSNESSLGKRGILVGENNEHNDGVAFHGICSSSYRMKCFNCGRFNVLADMEESMASGTKMFSDNRRTEAVI